jgi:photosystem II stability/assembly factor-like uncharacterized protein
VDIIVCDSKNCGFCGLPSDGCSVVFAVAASSGASPGVPAEVLFTQDGGSNWGDTSVTGLAANESPSVVGCVGTYLVVISNDSGSLFYAPITDILNGDETWTEVTTGFVVGGEPNAMFSLGPSYSWIVGDGGYVYFSSDPTGGVSVQTAGGVTTQNLNAIHGTDILNAVAVGNSNAVLYTRDGGVTWQAVTGPASGVNLNTVFMRTTTEWWVGAANGNLYYTRDSGATWATKSFAGSGAGSVGSVVFVTPSVGYLSHATAAPAGRIFRTIDGGYSWYLLPEATGSVPANDAINKIAVCEDANIIYAGGLGDNATDGIIVKGS